MVLLNVVRLAARSANKGKIMKKKHEEIMDLHKKYGGEKIKHKHEEIADMHGQDGGMPMQHYHEEVSKLCGGGMAYKGKK